LLDLLFVGYMEFSFILHALPRANDTYLIGEILYILW